MSNRKEQLERWEKQIFREIPSQIPQHVVKSTYERMLQHCVTGDTGGLLPVWCCARTGEKVKARMVLRAIFDRQTSTQIDYAPVIELYCGACDKAPTTRKGTPIFSDQIQTLAV